MSLEKRLQQWLAAGVVDEPTAARIRAFEEARPKLRPLWLVTGLAGLAIGIGLLSVVASNWEGLSALSKIGGMALLGLGLAAGTLEADRQARPLPRELGLLLIYAWTLAAIALVGQVYQLGGNAAAALGVWSLLTAAAMAQARGGLLGTLWLIGLCSTWWTVLAWLGQRDTISEELAAGLATWPAPALLLLGAWPWLRAARPGLSRAATTFGALGLLSAASLLPLAFYDHLSSASADEQRGVAAALLGLLALAVAQGPLLADRAPPNRRALAQGGLLGLLGLLAATLVFGLAVEHPRADVIAALLFIGGWACVGALASATGAARTLSLATAMIGLRLVIIYFEVFGSLLDTGLGLILGGLVTLAMAAGWRKVDQRLHAASQGDRP